MTRKEEKELFVSFVTVNVGGWEAKGGGLTLHCSHERFNREWKWKNKTKTKQQVNAHTGSPYRIRPPKESNPQHFWEDLELVYCFLHHIIKQARTEKQKDPPVDSKWEKKYSVMGDSERHRQVFFSLFRNTNCCCKEKCFLKDQVMRN